MKVNVKYNEIEKITTKVNSKLSDINVLIDDFQKDIDSIKSSWKGNDADAFLEESKKYIDKTKTDNNYFIDIINSLKKITEEYKKIDNEFLSDVKKESVE